MIFSIVSKVLHYYQILIIVSNQILSKYLKLLAELTALVTGTVYHKLIRLRYVVYQHRQNKYTVKLGYNELYGTTQICLL